MSRKIEFEKLRNTRDLGGMKTADGRTIKTGKLIRSGHLIAASEKDQEKLAGLIDTVVDFRSDRECTERPEPHISGTNYYHIPVLEETKPGVTRDEDSYEEVRKKMLGEAEIARKYMVRVYGGFVTSEHCRAQYERFIRLLLEDHGKAVLWHCTAGKDRAGFGTVIVQKLHIRDDIVHPQHVVVREKDPAVDDQILILVFKNRHVAAEFTEAA